MSRRFYTQIPKTKAELPFLIVFGIIGAVTVAFHYGFFGWKGAGIALVLILALYIFIYFKQRGDYFVEADAEGIRWRQSLISRYSNIPWKYLQRIDYLEFEINFMMKESAQVVSFATSSLTDEQAIELKEIISEILKDRSEEQ